MKKQSPPRRRKPAPDPDPKCLALSRLPRNRRGPNHGQQGLSAPDAVFHQQPPQPPRATPLLPKIGARQFHILWTPTNSDRFLCGVCNIVVPGSTPPHQLSAHYSVDPDHYNQYIAMLEDTAHMEETEFNHYCDAWLSVEYPSATVQLLLPLSQTAMSEILLRNQTTILGKDQAGWKSDAQYILLESLLHRNTDVVARTRPGDGNKTAIIAASIVEQALTVIVCPTQEVLAQWTRRLEHVGITYRWWDGAGPPRPNTFKIVLVLFPVDTARIAMLEALDRAGYVRRV
ncbi:hypothetical protein C8R47DRAFT_1077118, partial [Mycena vitilis]